MLSNTCTGSGTLSGGAAYTWFLKAEPFGIRAAGRSVVDEAEEASESRDADLGLVPDRGRAAPGVRYGRLGAGEYDRPCGGGVAEGVECAEKRSSHIRVLNGAQR